MRRRNLQQLKVLDTPAEERFDRVTRLAQRLFDVPIALVSLVDEDRQWFKSRIGLSISETPRDISFCGHAILDSQPLVIPDARADERFADNPLVLAEPHIRFYAGCPLSSPDGSRLGTLCVMDTRARTLGEADVAALVDLAKLAERELTITQLAMTDELTNIANRRGFIQLARATLELCRRKSIPAALAFLDLDKLKPINDNLGHATGDQVLKDFAGLMQDCLRNSDVLGRLGGDEFAILMTGATVEDSSRVLSDVRSAVARYNDQSKRRYPLGFSAGVIDVDLTVPVPVEHLLTQADTLMYRDKKPASPPPTTPGTTEAD